MNYEEILEYLFSCLPVYHRIGPAAYKANLNNTLELCEMLNNPQDNFKSIHIAGTNGKGSVSHFLASILQEQGFKTGLYTSPHLTDFRERIKINSALIDKDFITDFVKKHKDNFNRIGLSFFEMTVGLAFEYFRKENIDIAVIETGLGGRLDSTNVINPVLSIITNISFDHKALLGDTLEKIAEEKAGIIKEKAPVIIGEKQIDTKNVFLKKAIENNAEIYFAEDYFSVEDYAENAETLEMIIKDTETSKSIKLSSALKGLYQLKNILSVLQTVKILNQKGYGITELAVKNGVKNVVKNTGLRGRWQIIAERPLTICDVAHNEAGIKEILQQISKLEYDNLHFVIGMVNDKEYEKILELLPEKAKYYFCKADIPRGLDATILKESAKQKGLKGEKFESVKLAFLQAKANASEKDLIFIGGSIFVVAEILSFLGK